MFIHVSSCIFGRISGGLGFMGGGVQASADSGVLVRQVGGFPEHWHQTAGEKGELIVSGSFSHPLNLFEPDLNRTRIND